MKDKLIKLSTLVKLLLFTAFVVSLVQYGAYTERQSRKDYFKRLAQAQEVSSKMKHMSTYNWSLAKVIGSRVVGFIND